MNIYRKLNENQIRLLEETGNIIEDKSYTINEIEQIQNEIANYIFSKSKNDIKKEMDKFDDILMILENKKHVKNTLLI